MLKKCPKCGSRRVGHIYYGLPLFNEEMFHRMKNEQLYLGGCCISDDDPLYHCFECGKNVGSPPILISKRGKEDYRDIVTAVRFNDGGFFGGYDEVTIKKTDSGIIADISPNFQRDFEGGQRTLAEKEWTKLLDRLFCKLYVHEWKKQYYNSDIMDGEQWELEIRLTGRRVRNYSGSNEFPAYWNELQRTFRPFFKSPVGQEND